MIWKSLIGSHFLIYILYYSCDSLVLQTLCESTAGSIVIAVYKFWYVWPWFMVAAWTMKTLRFCGESDISRICLAWHLLLWHSAAFARIRSCLMRTLFTHLVRAGIGVIDQDWHFRLWREQTNDLGVTTDLWVAWKSSSQRFVNVWANEERICRCNGVGGSKWLGWGAFHVCWRRLNGTRRDY